MVMSNVLNSRYSVRPLLMTRGEPTLGLSNGPTRTTSCRMSNNNNNNNNNVNNNNNRNRNNNLNILHWNAEGIQNKKATLAERLKQEDIDVACIQETHLKENLRLSMRGYQVVRQDRTDRIKGGVLILIKNSLPYQEIIVDTENQAEIQGIRVIMGNETLTIFNEYCPVDRNLSLGKIEIGETSCIVVGDFNSHSEAWSYSEADRRGEEVEDWQIDKKLLLINDPSDPL